MEFLTSPEFQTALGTLILITIGGLATYLTRGIVGLIKAKTTAEQLNTLRTIAAIAVQAVEQSGLGGELEDKKQSAINLVNIFLTQAGITGINADQIDAAIEAAVLEVLDQEDVVEVDTEE